MGQGAVDGLRPQTKRARAHVWRPSADGRGVVCGVCFATRSVTLAVQGGKPVVVWHRTGGEKCRDTASARRKRAGIAKGAAW